MAHHGAAAAPANWDGMRLRRGPLHEIVRVDGRMLPLERMGVDRLRCTQMMSLDQAPAADYLRSTEIRKLGDILSAEEA
jgi:hypothetical protein